MRIEAEVERGKYGTYHLDVLIVVHRNLLDVDVLGFHLRERLVRGRDGGEECLDTG